MEETQLTLAKALQYKNRIVKEINRRATDIQTYNTIMEGSEQEVDVPKIWEERKRLVLHLIDVKLAINKANGPIQRLIFELSEIKTEINLLTGLSTNHGPVRDRYMETSANYVACFRKKNVDEKVTELNRRLDEIQEKIDAHNHTVKITVENTGLV